MQEEFGDDIQVIFVESQGSNEDQVERFKMEKKWVSENAIWTSEAPFETGASGIPHCVVLGNDGEVLINDHPGSAHTAIEEAIAAQLKLAKKGAKDTPPTCAKAMSDFEKGNFAAAITALEAVKEGAEKEAADKLSSSLTTRLNAKIARVKWYIDAAELDKADKLAAALTKGAAGLASIEEKVKELNGELAAKEMAAEREAGKALAKALGKIAKDGLDPAVVKAFKAVAEKYAQTKAGKRAEHLVAVSQIALN